MSSGVLYELSFFIFIAISTQYGQQKKFCLKSPSKPNYFPDYTPHSAYLKESTYLETIYLGSHIYFIFNEHRTPNVQTRLEFYRGEYKSEVFLKGEFLKVFCLGGFSFIVRRHAKDDINKFKAELPVGW